MKVLCSLMLLLGAAALTAATADGRHKLVIIAGKPSHPAGMHEFRAGSMILQRCLAEVGGLVVERHDMGWVKDEATLADADAVVIYADGGKGHPALQGDHLKTLEAMIARGVGFGCMHYGVEVPADQGGEQFKRWIGGHYEHAFSCNPIWEPQFREFPNHPITHGVKPFQISDEWYINMRFAPAFGDGIKPAQQGGNEFVPILVATPPDATRDGPYVYPKGPYPHIQEQKGQPEAVLWSLQRADGGRGFGFTGGHFHKNWANDDFRRCILNALVWVTGIEVPADGIASQLQPGEIERNLDPKPASKPKAKGKTALVPRVFQRGESQ